MDLTNISDIKALLARHGFHFSKSMGQNFLIEDWVPRDIAHSAELDEHCGVLEIGPGIGPLTVQLAQQAGKVVSVELDRSLLPILKETVRECGNVEIVPGDVMKLDIPQLVAEKFQGLTPMACANLPYNITTPVITLLLESGCFRRITVMIQREVAKRICAQPGTSDFGAFSLFCQYHAQCEYLFGPVFPPRPQGDLGSDWHDSAGGPPGGLSPQAAVLRHPGRLCPAEKDPAQRPLLGLRQSAVQRAAA